MGALIITYTILGVGVPYYDYSIMGPKPYSNCEIPRPVISQESVQLGMLTPLRFWTAEA